MSGITSCGSTPYGPEVYFLVLPGTMLLDFAGTSETLRVAADFGAPFRIHYVGPADLPRTSIGLTLGGVEPLPERLPRGAIVVIPGVEKSARDYLLPAAHLAAAWLARSVGPEQLLCTVCSGAFLAAESGLLQDHACTTHHSLTRRLAREYPRLEVVENRIFVRDRNVLTSAGVTAGVDLALHLVSELAGPRVAVEVARLLVLYFRRAGSDPQLSPWLLHRNHIDPRVHGAQDLVIGIPRTAGRSPSWLIRSTPARGTWTGCSRRTPASRRSRTCGRSAPPPPGSSSANRAPAWSAWRRWWGSRRRSSFAGHSGASSGPAPSTYGWRRPTPERSSTGPSLRSISPSPFTPGTPPGPARRARARPACPG